MSDQSAELPKSWVQSTLSQIVKSVSYGYTASAESTKVGPKMLRITDLQNGQVNWESVPYCRCDSVEKYALKAGDIVVARTGATTGKSFLLAEIPEPTVYASYLIRIETSEECPPDFLSLFMQSRDYWGQITEVSKGTAQPGANASILAALNVPIAPVTEQHRIVSKVNQLRKRSRSAREALDAVGPLLEQFRQSVLAAAFRGDLTADWRAAHPNAEPASGLLARNHTVANGEAVRRRIAKKGTVYIDREQFDNIPNTWQYATVQDLLDCRVLIDFVDGNHGSLYPRKEEFGLTGAKFITAKQIMNGSVDFATAPLLNFAKAKQLKKGWAKGGDVLLTHNATVGRVGRVPVGVEEFLLGTSVTYYRPNPTALSADYLYFLMTSSLWQQQLEGVMEQTTRDQVSIQKQAFFIIPIPPFAEQQAITDRIVKQLDRIVAVQQVVDGAIGDLAVMDQSILSKAFRGELVPQDPSDEPASELLSHIQRDRFAEAKRTRKSAKKLGRKLTRESVELKNENCKL